jgi:hypothetical protein
MSQQNAPLTPWQAVMGFAPTRETPAAQVLAGAKKLVLHLRREYARCLAAWHQSGNAHARPYGLFGPEDTPIVFDPEPEAAGAQCQQPDPPCAPAAPGDSASSREPAVQHETLNSKPETCSSPPDPQSTACPFALWDPVFQIAAALALSECQLTRYCKLASGLSARQWWDLVKAQDPATGVVARLREELARDAAGFLAYRDSFNKFFEEFLRHVQYERRMRGGNTSGRALHWGYRNSARMQDAVFVLEGRTLGELEMEMLHGLYADWKARCEEARRVRNEVEARASAELVARHAAARAAELAALRAADPFPGPPEGGEPEYGDAPEDRDALPQDAALASAQGEPRVERTSVSDRGDGEGREDRVQRPRHRVTGYGSY